MTIVAATSTAGFILSNQGQAAQGRGQRVDRDVGLSGGHCSIILSKTRPLATGGHQGGRAAVFSAKGEPVNGSIGQVTRR